MPQPRHIYASTLSRRERSWGRPRRQPGLVAARLVGLALTASGALLVMAELRPGL